MAALHGAVPVVEMDHVAGPIAQDLHLDVPGAVHVAEEQKKKEEEDKRRKEEEE